MYEARMSMTPERLGEIEAVIAKATEGPWTIADGHIVIEEGGTKGPAVFCSGYSPGDPCAEDEDLVFACVARWALPNLATALREAWGVMDALAEDFEKTASEVSQMSQEMARQTGLPPDVAGFPIEMLGEWATRLRRGRGE